MQNCSLFIPLGWLDYHTFSYLPRRYSSTNFIYNRANKFVLIKFNCASVLHVPIVHAQFPLVWKCYKTICSYVSCAFIKIWSIFHALQTSRVLHVSTNTCWCMNIPFWSCMLGCQALNRSGQGWPCYDANVASFQMYITLLSCELDTGLYYIKVTFSLSPNQKLGN